LKCSNCGWEWTPRVDDPKKCPGCQRFLRQSDVFDWASALEPEPWKVDLSKEITTMGSLGAMDLGKTKNNLALTCQYARARNLKILTNVLSFRPPADVKVGYLTEFRQVLDLPRCDERKYVVDWEELDKTLNGRNFGSDWNQTLSRLTGDIRRHGVAAFIVSGQAERGIDTWVRQNLNWILVPTRKLWRDPGTSLEYATFWAFKTYAAYETMSSARILSGGNYSQWADLYRSETPFSEVVYDKNEEVPIAWSDQLSDEKADDLAKEFILFCVLKSVELTKSMPLTISHFERWSSEREGGDLLLSRRDTQRIVSRVFSSLPKKEKPRPRTFVCDCPRLFSNEANARSHAATFHSGKYRLKEEAPSFESTEGGEGSIGVA
jgi:hypothetical protein